MGESPHRRQCLRAWLTLILLVLTALSTSIANATVTVAPEADYQSLDGQGHFLHDPEQRFSIETLLAEGADAPWVRPAGTINFGYTTDTYWYRLSLQNPTEQPVERLLEISYPLLDDIEFFRIADAEAVEHVLTGDSRPHDTRPLDHRTFVFPVTLEAGEQADIYLRIATSGSHQIPMRLWEPTAFFAANEADMVGRSMFYGMLVVVIIFNLFLYSVLREGSYLYYVLMNASMLVLMISLHGVGLQYLYPGMPALHERITLISSGLLLVFFCLFARAFLCLPEKSPGSNRYFKGLLGVTLLNSVLALFLPYSASTRMSVVLALVVSISMLVVGAMLLYRRERSARYFMAAWVALLVGGLVWILSLFGIIPTNFWIQYAIEIGVIAQAVLLSFALGDRFNREREIRLQEQRARLEAMEQRERAERDLIHQASHHALTGLPNRTLLESALEAQMERLKGAQQSSLALVLIHFRGFDDINKTLGHENADRLLCLLAERMNRVVQSLPDSVPIEQDGQQSYSVAHVEGITFACAFHPPRQESMVMQMERLVEEISRPLDFQGLSLDIRMVGGCSFYPDDSDDVATLLRHAFIAFDQADSDVSHVAIYAEAVNPYSERRLRLMTELRRAIYEDELELHCQPQVRVSTGEVCGFEVLLRWTHPEYGFIPPDEFIPMAEQTGLIRPLTRWVLDKAMVFCGQMRGQGKEVRISVNISAVNLQEPDFAEGIAELLERHGLSADALILEVTETATMIDPKNALRALRVLYNAGIRLAIDDFGTGYSSLSYVRKLPVHEIKIDRSFVMEMDQNCEDATIVRTTINMCHDLGFEVVAEGVESGDSCELLRGMSCDVMQGYYLARPMPTPSAPQWLEDYRSRDQQHGAG